MAERRSYRIHCRLLPNPPRRSDGMSWQLVRASRGACVKYLSKLLAILRHRLPYLLTQLVSALTRNKVPMARPGDLLLFLWRRQSNKVCPLPPCCGCIAVMPEWCERTSFRELAVATLFPSYRRQSLSLSVTFPAANCIKPLPRRSICYIGRARRFFRPDLRPSFEIILGLLNETGVYLLCGFPVFSCKVVRALKKHPARVLHFFELPNGPSSAPADGRLEGLVGVKPCMGHLVPPALRRVER